jgi:putative ABC transport system ATP-binding protein
VLKLRAVSRSFREGERLHRVLEGANAEIREREFVAIVGRSGSGKSTLLNLISGIDAPDAGTIEFDGTVISALPEPERTLFRRRHVGFVYQFFNLIPTLNVEENVRLALELDGVRGVPARRRARELLEQVGLGARLTSAIDVLSGGEQQRVAMHAPSCTSSAAAGG